MPAYYAEELKNIDVAHEFRKPHPLVAQVKYDSAKGILPLLEGVKFKRGDGAYTEKLTEAVIPYEALLTGRVDNTWEQDFSANVSEKDIAVFHFLESSLQNAVFSSRWKDDGVSEPTDSCKALAIELAMLMFNHNSILPVSIAPSIEEGVMLEYLKGEKKLLVEVYNDGDIAGLIRNGSSILKAVDLDEHEEVLRLSSEYKTLLS